LTETVFGGRQVQLGAPHLGQARQLADHRLLLRGDLEKRPAQERLQRRVRRPPEMIGTDLQPDGLDDEDLLLVAQRFAA